MARSHTSALTRGYIIAVISAVVLSTTAVFIRHLTQTYHIPPLVLAFWRDFFVALTLLVVLGIARPGFLRVSRSDLAYLAGYGLVLAAFNAVWTVSVALNGAAVGTVLAYSSVGFTALLGWWLLKERLDWATWVAVAFAFGGCALVSGAADPQAWQLNLAGVLTGIFSGLGYAGYSLMGRSANQRGLSPWTTLLFTFGFAALFLFGLNLMLTRWESGSLHASAGNLFWLGDAWTGWLILFILGAVPTVGGFGLYNYSMVYLASGVANLVATLEPVFTALLAVFLLGERFTFQEVGGSLMILTGIVLLRLYEGWQLKTQSESVPS